MAYELISSERAFQGRFVSVDRDTIALPDGQTAIREVVRRGEAAVIIPVDRGGRLLFVRQYRHPCRGMSLELPAGVLEPGEDPLVCAARELEEETGMRAGKIRQLCRFYTTIGFCDEVIHLFLAEELTDGRAHPDADEFLTHESYTLGEALALIDRGEIINGPSMIGVLQYDRITQQR